MIRSYTIRQNLDGYVITRCEQLAQHCAVVLDKDAGVKARYYTDWDIVWSSGDWQHDVRPAIAQKIRRR